MRRLTFLFLALFVYDGAFAGQPTWLPVPSGVVDVQSNMRGDIFVLFAVDKGLGQGSDAGLMVFDAALKLKTQTLVGGSGNDFPHALAVSPDGSIYILGTTTSENFPVTPTAVQKNRYGDTDVFVVRLSPELEVTYATYFGGNSFDETSNGKIVVGPKDEVLFSGSTHGRDLPGAPAGMRPRRGDVSRFISKIVLDRPLVEFSRYVPMETSAIEALAIDVDTTGHVYAAAQGKEGIHLLKLKPTGDVLINTVYGAADKAMLGPSFFVDGEGHMVFTVRSRERSFLVKLDGRGKEVFSFPLSIPVVVKGLEQGKIAVLAPEHIQVLSRANEVLMTAPLTGTNGGVLKGLLVAPNLLRVFGEENSRGPRLFFLDFSL